MTKQPKDINHTSSSENTFGTFHEWNETWKNIAVKNREIIKQYMHDTNAPPSLWSDKVTFDSEPVTNIFTQTMKKLEEQTKSKEEIDNFHLVDVQEFLKSTIHNVQKKIKASHLGTSLKHKKHREEGDENPFFFLLQQSSLLNLQFLKEAASRTHELDPTISRKLTLYTQRLVESLSLADSPLLSQTESENLAHKKDSKFTDKPSKLKPISNVIKEILPTFQVGQNLGSTPGKVVFQNDLFQLIFYEPLTLKVAKRPLLLIPPWSNKYYIFDLQKKNSFVRWALENGLSVFVVSWVNPSQRQSHKTFEDYIIEGVKEALDQVCKITNEEKINAVGYCTGGILLSCLMAYLEQKSPIGSATFIGTPFDYSKIDELGIFRCKRQYLQLKEYIKKEGNLDRHYMIQTLNLLKANDLIWSSEVNHYLLGHKAFPFDMLYWACDALRLPTKMHNTYVKEILIENSLMFSEGIAVKGKSIQLHNILTPTFIVAAREDHIAPWRSIYPLTQVVNNRESKFILSAGGHITGAFMHPHEQQHSYWSYDLLPKEADEWLKNAQKHSGSWWEEWKQWLGTFDKDVVAARIIPQKRVIEEAPGSYVGEGKGLT